MEYHVEWLTNRPRTKAGWKSMEFNAVYECEAIDTARAHIKSLRDYTSRYKPDVRYVWTLSKFEPDGRVSLVGSGVN